MAVAGCLFLLCLAHFGLGYELDDDIPLPPSYMEQPSQWQAQANALPSFRQTPPSYSQNYLDAYAQAGNEPVQANPDTYSQDQQQQYDYPQQQYESQQQYSQQYPRLAAADPNNSATPQNNPAVGPAASQNTVQPIPSFQADGAVLPVYTPPKKKHTEEEGEPYLTPQWQSDDGISNGRDPKIVAALEAITADLISRGKELTSERKWSTQVKSMLDVYKEKVSNVDTHIEKIRTEMKELLKKKRQIENVEVQQQLNTKLRLAQGDLEALDGAMSHVQSKADEFAEKKKTLEASIKKIETQVKGLQGAKSEPESDEESESDDHTSHHKSSKAESDEDEGTAKTTTANKTAMKGGDEDEEGASKLKQTANKTSTNSSNTTSKFRSRSHTHHSSLDPSALSEELPRKRHLRAEEVDDE